MSFSTFRIYLDDPDGQPRAQLKPRTREFLSGDRISGKVVLKLENDADISAVMIRFQGKAGTSVSNCDDIYAHNYDIFNYEETLFHGPFKMRADTYEWPFSFTLPQYFEITEKENPFNGENPRYTLGLQPLPPTCQGLRRGPACYKITYELSAKIPHKFSNWECKVLLNLSTIRLEALPEPQPETRNQSEIPHRRHYRFDENHMPRALSTRESIADKIQNKKIKATQTISFHVTMSAPTAIVIGKSYPIMAVVRAQATEIVTPDFEIRSVRALLKSRTYIRVPGGPSKDFHDEIKEDIYLNAGNPLRIPFPINEPIAVMGIFPIDKTYALPSFSSPSIAREYSLLVKMTVGCLDKDYETTCKWPLVVLYPPFMERYAIPAGISSPYPVLINPLGEQQVVGA